MSEQIGPLTQRLLASIGAREGEDVGAYAFHYARYLLDLEHDPPIPASFKVGDEVANAIHAKVDAVIDLDNPEVDVEELPEAGPGNMADDVPPLSEAESRGGGAEGGVSGRMWSCVACKEESEDEFDACWNCGRARGATAPNQVGAETQGGANRSESAMKEEQPVERMVDSELARATPEETRSARRVRVSARLIAGLLAAIVVAGGFAALGSHDGATAPTTLPSSSPSPSPTFAPYSYQELLSAEAKLNIPADCRSYKTILGRWNDIARKRTATVKDISTNPYDAYAFVRGRRDWLEQTTAARLDTSIEKIATQRLRKLAGINDSYITSSMRTSFMSDSMTACKVTSAYERTTAALVSLDKRTSKLIKAADRKPWYPRGYHEYWEDDNIAWRWSDSTRECRNSSFGYCWGILIRVHDYGCSSSVYAEIDIKSGSSVVDYSNDTLGGLSPGDVGELSFQHYGGSGTLSARLSEITCY